MSEHVPVHAQPTAERKLWGGTTAGADLCARAPATWSAMVRYEDQLVAEGWSKIHAGQIASAHYLGERPP